MTTREVRSLLPVTKSLFFKQNFTLDQLKLSAEFPSKQKLFKFVIVSFTGSGAGGTIVTYKQPREYKIAVAYMLAWSYGHVRVMSSYDFSSHDQVGTAQSWSYAVVLL